MIETKRLKIYPAARAQMEASIAAETDAELSSRSEVGVGVKGKRRSLETCRFQGFFCVVVMKRRRCPFFPDTHYRFSTAFAGQTRWQLPQWRQRLCSISIGPLPQIQPTGQTARQLPQPMHLSPLIR